ncbi:hypothetical protein DC522_19145 [Microvirga sp. KLBC 81]|uniref:fibronectin type III domain-containing protein n=1 Tax=Microvirga sp. KLBC 81 TaxID=1862707 RepID=UPI000D507927|nr:hypothetical protein [Microvirga sp. KLBC 81]PVE22765.1 hypothetical protein DC522_19145 [Microvirga sp. KLBC 81]
MALQTDRLVLAALGVLGDIPPNAIQPPLSDGIHLRWSFRTDVGFPWYGFFLFRRPHWPSRPVCFGQILPNMPPGPWPSAVLNTPFGQVRSDRPLVFTDDFPAGGVAEFDLRARAYIRFALDPVHSAYRVEARIGFRRRQCGQSCIDFRPRAGFVGTNPLVEAGATFEVYRHDGTLAPHTQVIQMGNLVGLNCGHRLDMSLPCKASAVELTLAHFSSPGRVRALDSAGGVVATASIPVQQGVSHLLKLPGQDIVRIVVDAPQDETLLQQLCFSCGTADCGAADVVTVKVLHGDLVLTQTTAQAAPGQVLTVTLDADTITAVELSGGEAALIELCFYFVSQNAGRGWEPVPDCEAPMCLPVMHPQYPCSPQPTSEAASEALALGRIGYGPAAAWAGEPFSELHAQLLDLVEDGPAGVPMALQQSAVEGTATPPDPDVGPPEMLQQYPLQLVLFASLHPAVAQMLGLYWADKLVQQNQPYDYLIVADHTGVGNRDAATVLGVIEASGFVDLDGYIVFNKRLEPAPPFNPPSDVRAYALPGAAIGALDGSSVDGTNNAGLRWDLDLLAPGVLAPGAALMYHVWRDNRGNAAAPAPSGSYALVTTEPVLVAEPELLPGVEPVRPLDWPPFPMHHIDRALGEGWYSYRISGIDIFGRHTPASLDARWFQWAPAPKPRPWYYQDPPADSAIHPSALRLLDKSGPPPPYAVEASALDPADPTLLKDAPYNTWFDALSAAEQQDLVGLRVRWQWTDAHMRQAPDTREFRIYLQSGFLNALPGRITAVAPAGATESDVQTDLANVHGADAWVGAWLRVGANAFRVTGSAAGTPLALRVRNIGAAEEIAPASGSACTLTVPQVYNTGTVSVTRGLPLVTGTNTHWTAHLVGMTFKVVGPFDTFVIAAVNSPTELVLDRAYEAPDKAAAPYGIRFPLYVDFLRSASWRDRFYVVPFGDHVTLATDDAGRPLRKYDVIIPAAGDAVRTGLQLATSLEQPVAYAHVGISAADDKQHTADDPKWATGDWGGRFGNEGPVSAPAKIFVVRRTPPPAPVAPPDSERVFASAADYHGRSFYTFRWVPSAGLRTHVFRALDDALFKTDWERRGTDNAALDPNQAERFPSEWNAAKRQQVAAELNALTDFVHDSGKAAAMEYYRALSNDSLRALAGLPGNERAFTQLTIEPLDPADPGNANRLGPDNPPDFVIDPGLRATIDTLDGRSRNRYFYRAAYVDGAHNRGPLGLASPPVHCPKVVPPRTPAIAKVLGGDRQVTLKWSSNREPDLADYRVFRVEGAALARDLRLMTLVHVETVATGDPAARPAQVVWIDRDVPAAVDLSYRVTARDDVGNESVASPPVTARAYRAGAAAPPYSVVASRETHGADSLVRVTWETAEALEILVQRRQAGRTIWVNLGDWLPAGTAAFEDATAQASVGYDYRLKGRDRSGRQSAASEVVSVPTGV